jgi:hypothetical protein
MSTGTLISGLTILCGSKPRIRNLPKTQIIWTNTWVAFLQLITTPLLLLGWIWSLVWATTFISISSEFVCLLEVFECMEDYRTKHRFTYCFTVEELW